MRHMFFFCCNFEIWNLYLEHMEFSDNNVVWLFIFAKYERSVSNCVSVTRLRVIILNCVVVEFVLLN